MPGWIIDLPRWWPRPHRREHRDRALALVVLPGGRQPPTAMAWLLLILAIPFLGFVLFLLFGRTSVGKKRRAQQARGERRDPGGRAPRGHRGPRAPASSCPPLVQTLRPAEPPPRRAAAELRQHRRADRGLPGRHRGDERARSPPPSDYVHVQFYISAWDEMTAPFFEELVRATERGVDGPVPLRPHRLPGHPGLQGHARQARGAPRSSGRRCCRSSRSRVRYAGPTCATTARSWSSTAGSRSAGRRT